MGLGETGDLVRNTQLGLMCYNRSTSVAENRLQYSPPSTPLGQIQCINTQLDLQDSLNAYTKTLWS